MKDYDLIVVGGGSGGLGAALTAARLGLTVLLLEAAETLGGTAVRGGVHTWEMGVGGTGLPFDLYRRLKLRPRAVGIYSYGRHWCWPRPDEPYRFPGGEQLLDPARRYVDTLRRHGSRGMGADEEFCRRYWHGVTIEPTAMLVVVAELAAALPNLEVRRSCSFGAVQVAGRRITSLELDDGTTVCARAYVDATGDVYLARAAGCRTRCGQEGRGVFAEPSAPDTDADRLNGATLVYRVTPRTVASVDPVPGDVPTTCWWAPAFPGICMNEMPGGGRAINALPLMDGREAAQLGYSAAHAECRRRVAAHWRHLQTTFAEFQRYGLSWVAPALGIREGPRVVGRYTLTEQDLRRGLSGQTHPDLVAIADHALDTHGHATGRAGCGELAEPYGVPYRCLLAADCDNLLVACRGASFSSLAASSCRLSRTMMQLGQAAATAAALAQRHRGDLATVPPDDLRAALAAQHVQLTWPAPAELQAHLAAEDQLAPSPNLHP